MQMRKFPEKQGLYDPHFEHDACGIGFVVNIKGRRTHHLVEHALTILKNLTHRGGVGAEVDTGDGAGILTQIPHEFFRQACSGEGIVLPEQGKFGIGMVFLPQDEVLQRACEDQLNQIIVEEGQGLLGWRTVPVESGSLGTTADACRPMIRQVFIGRSLGIADSDAFERKLYVIRKRAEREIDSVRQENAFYLASLSSRTIVYKGMLAAEQVPLFYQDLADEEFKTAIALVHSRFSTNTFPSWERAHPYRYIIHNGEINTLRANVNWMHAREAVLKSELFGKDLSKVLPIVDPDGSDSANFDNVLEFLNLAGRPLQHAAMMMIPEPWQSYESMSEARKAFYEYHSCLMEPWDGPAAVAFTDGVRVGAVLDRNGLRPARYCVTKDDLVIMASEVGVLDVPPEQVVQKDRLHPGRMLLIDTKAGRIISDTELKEEMASEHRYQQWLSDNMVHLESLPADKPQSFDPKFLRQRQREFGYTYEDLRLTLAPMAQDEVDPIGAMGYDAPLAVLSRRPQLLYNYFKQLFAQVTNPPIDAIREEIVVGKETFLGSEGDLLTTAPENCRQIKLKTPLLNNEDLAKLRNLSIPGFKSRVFDITFPMSTGSPGLEAALEELFIRADQAYAEGVNILILSDRKTDAERVPIPPLLAIAGLHHHLIRQGTRTKMSLVLESGEPREVHHFAVLLGYGASAINPYLALESIRDLARSGFVSKTEEEAVTGYSKAVIKGIVKVLSKMGISTIQSYQGAQIFEAVGLHQDVIDKYFTWTPSRIGGIKLDAIAQGVLERHCTAHQGQDSDLEVLESGGNFQWKKDGEEHLYNPKTIHELQKACRSNNYEQYKEYSNLINNPAYGSYTLRGLLEFKSDRQTVPLEEVESVESICRRFKTGAMSYGSISKEAHECLAIAMNRLGGKSNTGEGGEDPERFAPLPNGDSKRSAIKQVASGRFGVTSEYLVNAEEIQIKMAQGAKPGEGGQLPGRKVYPWIAKVRHSTPGVGLISPPPHHDIYSIEDLAELIHDLKNANREARISVKLVSEIGVGTIAAGVAKGRADVILISGYDGGTGASPRTSIRHAGLPWELGLAETHQTLVLNNLRSRVTLETDGKLMTGRDVVIAALLGAEEFGFATAPLVAIGCVMMRVCNLDTCPVGVATQHPELRKRFKGEPEYVVNLMRFIAAEMREIMAQLGFRSITEMVGHTEVLEPSVTLTQAGLDLSAILHQPDVSDEVGRHCMMSQDHGLEETLDNKVLLKLCQPALKEGKKVRAILPVRNTDRVVGTILGSEITKRFGAQGLPEDTISLHLRGSAGQSFGAFVPKGITLTLEGDANDYFGKGLSGGKVVAYPPNTSTFVPEENVIIGNVAFYGATSGEAYVYGAAGERFCVRNSGLTAVVEAVGDHGCEYMTGGKVLILGSTGRNFAAGMSGGIAYVVDEAGDFANRCNREMVELEAIEDAQELREVHGLIEKHALYTGSRRAKRILSQWDTYRSMLIRVIPRDYKRMLLAFGKVKSLGLTGEEAIMAAFDANRQELSRVSGN